MSKKERKMQNIRESVIGPQGAGPCTREHQYHTRYVQSDKWTGLTGHGTLRSHAVLGVMSHDLQTRDIVQGKQ